MSVIFSQLQLSKPLVVKHTFKSVKTPLAWSLVVVFMWPWSVTKAEDHRSMPSLTLAHAVEQVQQYQQSQGLWQAQQAIAEANIQQSKLWQNPSLSVEKSGFSNNQESELSVGISQTLDVFGERKASQTLAKVAQDQSSLKQTIYNQQLQLIVKYLWSEVVLAEIEANLLNEQLKVSEASLTVAQRRFQAGKIAQIDVDRVSMDHAGNKQLFQQAQLKRSIAHQQLANLWGENQVDAKVGSDLKDIWPSNTSNQVNANLAQNLLEKSLQIQQLESQANVDYLKAKARPNPTVNMRIQRTTTVQDNTDNLVAVGVSVPLNIFNRQQYGIQIAEAKQSLLTRQQAFYSKQNQLDVQTLLSEIKGLKAQFDTLTQQQIPLALRVQKKTLIGFEAGKLNVLDVQQASVQLQQVRLKSLDILKLGWQRAIESESLSLGIEPNQVMAKDALAQMNQNILQNTHALPVIGGGN